jgi:hypothetical protein
MLPNQLLSSFKEPIPQNPKRPDARYRVDCNCHPELRRVSVAQMHNIGGAFVQTVKEAPSW